MIQSNLKRAVEWVLARLFSVRFIIVVPFIFLTLGSAANPPLATKQQIGMFKNSKTCVVFEDGVHFYNAYIRDAVQKYWKTTSYEFIDQTEFEKRRHDSKYSFLVLMDGAWDKDPGGVSYSYLSLVLGDKAYSVTKMPELCSVPVSYTGDDSADIEYAIPAIVKFMQKHVTNLGKNHFIISLQGLNYYNTPTGFKDKVLLLNKDAMAKYVDTPDRIKTVYPYYIKLLSVSEIQAELSTNPTNALFQFHVGPAKDSAAGKSFEMIFDTEGNLYYYNSRKITNDNGDGFNLDDFKRIK